MEQPESELSTTATVVPQVQWTLDLASKSSAVLAILLSVCGFLVTSLYDSTFGFIEVNPFRPRTLAAGAWFLLAIAIPAAVAGSYTSWKRRSLKELTDRLILFWLGCQFFAIPLSRYFLVIPQSTAALVKTNWILEGIVWLGMLGVLVLHATKRVPSWLSTSSSIAITSLLVFHNARTLYLTPGHFDPLSAMVLWLFGVGVLTAMVVNGGRERWNMRDTQWANVFILFLTTLGLFGRYYYPHLDSAVGGGDPIAITIYFSKDSPILPSRTKPVYLVDESDAGFYVLGKADTKAAFIPRADISLILFSDDPTKFSFLNNK